MAPVATSPSVVSSAKRSAFTINSSVGRKRRRTSYACPPHPQGIKPSANALLTPSPLRQTSLGFLSLLDDDLLLHLLSTLPLRTLAQLRRVSRVLLAYASHEALWREALLSEAKGIIESWKGTWFRTYAYQMGGAKLTSPTKPVQVKGLYSDVLHAPWRLSHAPLDLSPSDDDGHKDTIPRLPSSTTRNFFQANFAGKLPAILTGAALEWPALGWTLDHLTRRCEGVKVQAEAMRCEPTTYVDYARAQEALVSPTKRDTEEQESRAAYHGFAIPDESPLYLFDAALPALIETDWSVPSLLSSYSHAQAWHHDLFGLLGSVRPDYRWIIAGPSRSGSGWHKDPNATSAWNGVLSGAKYWLFLPPDTPPPGVFVSQDQAEVTAPLSIAEWAEGYLKLTRIKHGPREFGGDGKLREGICAMGDVAYVPAGWWHLVVNLEESVAFTQNFISPYELSGVLQFMRKRPEQVSGFKPTASSSGAAQCDDEAAPLELFDDFCSKLREYDAGLLEDALSQIERSPKRAKEGRKKEAWWTRMKEESARAPAEGAGGFALELDLDGEELGEVPW